MNAASIGAEKIKLKLLFNTSLLLLLLLKLTESIYAIFTFNGQRIESFPNDDDVAHWFPCEKLHLLNMHVGHELVVAATAARANSSNQ